MWQYCVGPGMLHKQVDVERIAELLVRYCLAWHDTKRAGPWAGLSGTAGRNSAGIGVMAGFRGWTCKDDGRGQDYALCLSGYSVWAGHMKTGVAMAGLVRDTE